ncbi:MAG: glutathione S-transferase family protein [Rhodospirillaceae bacterium]|jgi:glutathione S-transferase|nr:glutathione S-transferase family protein [Rhodospirillaceae bacterium]
MLELFHNDMSTCSQKVRMALAEKGLEWTSHHLNLRAADQQQPDYLALNPNGVVPTLRDEGTVVIESTIINEYIDDAFPDPALRPVEAAARARMRLWTKQLDDGLHAATGVVSSCIAFRFQHLDGKTTEELDSYLARMPDAAKRERQTENIYKGVDSKFFPAAVHRFDKLLGDMNDALAAGPWLAGNEFSLADVAYTPYAVRLDHLQLQGMWDKRPAYADWYERLKQRPAFKKAVTDWINPSYLEIMVPKGREAWPGVRETLAAT